MADLWKAVSHPAQTAKKLSLEPPRQTVDQGAAAAVPRAQPACDGMVAFHEPEFASEAERPRTAVAHAHVLAALM